MSEIPKHSLDFLKKLSKNNDRDWFNANKDTYIKAQGGIIDFADGLLHELQKTDDIETPTGKKSMYRIYRDVRFSKNKTPYNTHWSGGFKRSKPRLRGGYYYRVSPGQCVVAGGFWGPNPKDLKRIREEIDFNGEAFLKLINDKKFVNTFGTLEGEGVKTAPKGYPKDHQYIELLRKKQFLLIRNFTDKEALAPDYPKKVIETYKAMRPFFDFMSEVLTTDSNGESLY
jgi:uncharacterized protein (TIGR02453 family)